MEITEVRIKLVGDTDDRLRAFCSVTFDNCFVVRDLKIIDGSNGPFVAMPSRKLTSHCSKCGAKNHLRANYCNQCGERFRFRNEGGERSDGRAKLYADIAHPINSECREAIQKRVIEEFCDEEQRSKQPNYVSRYDDIYEDDHDFVPADKPAAKEVVKKEAAGTKSAEEKELVAGSRHEEVSGNQEQGSANLRTDFPKGDIVKKPHVSPTVPAGEGASENSSNEGEKVSEPSAGAEVPTETSEKKRTTEKPPSSGFGDGLF
ncbi:MAG: SpoVG family protein [Pirellulaceae bacterium]|nr:SpoVG family protein [Pirellulaceae bacterium]